MNLDYIAAAPVSIHYLSKQSPLSHDNQMCVQILPKVSCGSGKNYSLLSTTTEIPKLTSELISSASKKHSMAQRVI